MNQMDNHQRYIVFHLSRAIRLLSTRKISLIIRWDCLNNFHLFKHTLFSFMGIFCLDTSPWVRTFLLCVLSFCHKQHDNKQRIASLAVTFRSSAGMNNLDFLRPKMLEFMMQSISTWKCFKKWKQTHYAVTFLACCLQISEVLSCNWFEWWSAAEKLWLVSLGLGRWKIMGY